MLIRSNKLRKLSLHTLDLATTFVEPRITTLVVALGIIKNKLTNLTNQNQLVNQH